jgi:hypothetical protein
VLRQVIAIVLGLAIVAERLQARCFPVRFLVLLVLRRAEAVTLGYLSGYFVVDDAGCDDARGSGPADAAALALRFRAMAAALQSLLAPDGIPGGGRAARGGMLPRRASGDGRRAAAPRRGHRWAHDTS